MTTLEEGKALMLKRLLLPALAALVFCCAPAWGAPTTVQIRIEGATSTIFEGPVTTDAKSIDKGDGPHACDGTNAGANPQPGPTVTSTLDDASLGVGFTWDGQWNPGFQDFLVNRIGPDASDLATSRFWNFAVNFVPAQVGGCQQAVHQRDDVLFAYDSSCNCPPDYTKQLLKLSGPSRAVLAQPFEVTVTDGETGAAVEGAAVGSGTTDAQGHATVALGSAGVAMLKASKPNTVRSNAVAVCVPPQGAGDCGAATPAAGAVGGKSRDLRAPDARISSPRNGARYRRGPRLLSGTAVDDGTGVTVVKLALRRHAGGHCKWWSARREKFVGRNCHRKVFFAIGSSGRWSYLLPERLAAGRYVLDVKAFDRARNHDGLFAPGRNRVVFGVLDRNGGRGRSLERARGVRRSHGTRGARVQVMVVGREGVLAGARSVRSRPALITASGRRCRVPGSSPLAALVARLRRERIRLHARDYGRCSRRSANGSGQLFIDRISDDRNRGGDGWFYKLGDRAPTSGAADLAGIGRPLRSGDRVLWFYCVFDAHAKSCQRSLRIDAPRATLPSALLPVTVRAFDNEGRGSRAGGVTVTLGGESAVTDLNGAVAIRAPGLPGKAMLAAGLPGALPAFPVQVDVLEARL
jgi:hypothetical protein